MKRADRRNGPPPPHIQIGPALLAVGRDVHGHGGHIEIDRLRAAAIHAE